MNEKRVGGSKIMRLLQPALSDFLCEEGFLEYDEGWRLHRAPMIVCIEPQARSDGAAFCINVGVHYDFLPVAGRPEEYPPPDIREPECELRSRIGEGGEQWWPLFGVDQVELRSQFEASIHCLISSYSDPIRKLGSIKVAEIDDQESSRMMLGLTRSRRLLLLARVKEWAGDKAGAREAAVSGLEGSAPVGPRVQLKRLLSRLDN